MLYLYDVIILTHLNYTDFILQVDIHANGNFALTSKLIVLGDKILNIWEET